MKSWKIVAVCVAGTLAAIAADMTGDYNTWLGYIAGINADGERTTVQGAGAGGEATGLIRTDLIGAAAGAYASNLYDCVGIGYRALRGSADMSEVVAIGAGAFTNKTRLSKATWLNGHFAAFGQNNTFWIKANPKQADTNAPIHFANGVLSLNADTVRINGETAGGGGGGGGTSAPVLVGYDLYVDPVNGDDSFAGTTPGTAKRTIDGAYAAVTNHDMTICLMAGEHKSPSGRFAGIHENGKDVYPEFRVHLVAPYGAEKTILDGEKKRAYWGCNYLISSITGCTIRNFISPVNSNPMFFAVYFYRCTIELEICSKPLCAVGFYGCILEQCSVNGVVSTTGAWQYMTAGRFFYQSDLFDSVFDIAVTNNTSGVPSFFQRTYVENCFLSIEAAYNFHVSDTESSILGNRGAFVDCTVICEQSVNSFNVPPATGCLFGLGDITNSIPTYSTVTGSVCTNAAAVLATIQSDYRPSVKDWRFRFAGYNSAADRSVRNSMENSILSGLMVNETLALPAAAKMSLLSMIEENEAVEAPQTVNRSTNAAPEKLEIEIHPDEEE